MDRVQTISRGAVVFKERCCRASYGVLCLEEYNPANPAHIGQKVTLDARDGKKWVENQIDWFVKQVRATSTARCGQLAKLRHWQGRKRLHQRRSKALCDEDQTRQGRSVVADPRSHVQRTSRATPKKPRPRWSKASV